MEIAKLSDDLNIISALSDEPNDVDGLSAQELKAAFDKSGLLVQTYINDVLLPAISELDKSIRADATEYTNEVAQRFALGKLSPGSVTNEMLATPIYKTEVYFNDDSWEENDDGEYELTIPYDQHGISVPFTYSLAHNIDDVYHNNTMAANSVCVRRDNTNNIILVGDAAFSGRLIMIS